MAYIQIDKNNFFYNLDWFSKRVGSKEKLAVVLKDNAYGHGLEIMANLSSKFGIKSAVVRDYNEAKLIKRYFDDIIILGDSPKRDSRCSFVLNSIDDIKKAESSSRVELKVDTGMARNGVGFDEVKASLDLIKRRDLKLVGVLTHYRSADELSSELFWQYKRFNRVKEIVKLKGFRDIRFHSFNSSATIRLNSKDEDLIRVGIGIYGYSEINPIFNPPKLKPVLSLYADRVATREIKKGSRVGYGGKFTAKKDMRISTYNIGYGDGLFRGDSNSPLITAEGLPILGRVSMDYISLETTKANICIFNNAKVVGEKFNTISYEILTKLSSSIKRVVI